MTIAVKKIRYPNSKECYLEMQRELGGGLTMASLSMHHPNIVDTLGVSFEANSDYLVGYVLMRYIQGCNLFDYIHRNKAQIELEEFFYIAIPIAQGLSFLHSKDYIHRDVKSLNILRDENGCIKICDFGNMTNDRYGTHHNNPYQCPLWQAPELASNSNYTKAVDVWSFGWVLYELATGNLPYNVKIDSPYPPTLVKSFNYGEKWTINFRPALKPVKDSVEHIIRLCCSPACPFNERQRARPDNMGKVNHLLTCCFYMLMFYMCALRS